MTFDSLTFLVFLASVYALYWGLRSWRARKCLLLLASYVFYGAWNPLFVLLLIATTGFDFLLGRLIDREQEKRRRRLFLGASIVVNLGVLAFFKYAQFFTNTALDLAALFGLPYHPVNLGILLPIGISFYTFESMSYVIDVYRRQIRASSSLLDYGLFVTFFPHLVAGPILRYHDFVPQCAEPKAWRDSPGARALGLIIVGLALKVCLADLIFAPVADKVFALSARPGANEAWLGAFAFSLQVYCDFAGYSLCAIGAALLFGFRFRANFESPFGAIGMSELWTRWHISLSSWLRDYVFTPLGGYRQGRLRGHLNLVATFLLCGLWHGAAWTYVVWGGLNGAFQVAERLFRDSVWDFTRARAWPLRSLLMLLTFVMFSIAVVFFRAPSLPAALRLIATMFGNGPVEAQALLAHGEFVVAAVCGLLLLAAQQWSARVRGWEWLDQAPAWQRAGVLTAGLAAILFSPGFNPAFIYFQF